MKNVKIFLYCFSILFFTGCVQNQPVLIPKETFICKKIPLLEKLPEVKIYIDNEYLQLFKIWKKNKKKETTYYRKEIQEHNELCEKFKDGT